MPKVLISDKLSPARSRFSKTAASKPMSRPDSRKTSCSRSSAIMTGLAIRSATKVPPKSPRGEESEGDRPRRHRRRQCRYSRRNRRRHDRDEHALRQFHHHRRACHRADDGAGPRHSRRQRLHPGRQMGKEPLHGRGDHRQGAGPDRLRQYRLHRRRPRQGTEDAGHRVRSLSVAGTRHRSGRRKSRARTIFWRGPISSPCICR